MSEGFQGEIALAVGVARAVVGESLDPTPCVVVAWRSVEGAVCEELQVEQSDASFDGASTGMQPLAEQLGSRAPRIRFLLGVHADAFAAELAILGGVGLVSDVAQERTFERCFEKRVEPLDVVPVAWDLLDEGDASFRREDHVLPHAVEVRLQRSAVADLCQAAEAVFPLHTHEAADMYGMGVDNEKGGWPSPSKAQKA